MKLFGNIKTLIEEARNGENVWSLEVVEVVLVQCNLVDNQCQQKSEILYTFTPNISYLLKIEPTNFVFLKTCNTGFDDIVLTFTYQNGRPYINDTLFYRNKNKEV